MTRLVRRSEAETRETARRLAARLRPGDVIALQGPLGAGKTTFVRGLAEGLGLDAREVSSPTYLLLHEYALPAGGDTVLAHLDGYRLATPAELETIGWDELLAAADVIIAVEWPERFGDELPDERVTVDLAHVDEHTRAITITATGRLASRFYATHRALCPICGKSLPDRLDTAPFCSKRCRLVDLGEWLGGKYSIGQSPEAGDDF